MVGVTNGALRITGVGRNPTGKGNVSGGLCWCGHGGRRLYGTWKVRAKFDTGAGYGQVIGLWPTSNDPADGSITLAAAREADKRTARGFVLWRTDRQFSDERVIAGDFTGWHTYTLQWRPGTLRMWVDDLVLYDSSQRGPDVVLPTKPMNLFIQQAIGPWEGVPAPNASTPDEVVLHVDWVRYWA